MKLIKKLAIISAVIASLLLVMYYGVMFGIVQIVLFLSDVIMQIHSLVW